MNKNTGMTLGRNIFLFAVILTLFTACQKEYYIDSGIHEATYDGTIYEYLNDKPMYFDSLVQVIDVAEMQDVFKNETITFFAPPSSSIFKAVKKLNNYLRENGQDTVRDLKQIDIEVWKETLSLYVFEGKYLLKDYAQIDTLDLGAYGGQGYTSLNSRPMNIGVVYNDAAQVKYAGYRQLLLSYIPDFNHPKQDLINVPIASSNIQPTNGVVHVLQFHSHTFGFEPTSFILAAISKGIKSYEEANGQTN